MTGQPRCFDRADLGSRELLGRDGRVLLLTHPEAADDQ
jgi:hypothetical protein